MEAIIFIGGRIRQGHFPRLQGFSYNQEHEKWLYLGRPLTLDEFNEAAEAILDPADRKYPLSVRLIEAPKKQGAKGQSAPPALETEAQADAPAAPQPEEAPVVEPKATKPAAKKAKTKTE